MTRTASRQHWARRQHRKEHRLQATLRDLRELVLIQENIIVRRSTGTEDSSVTQEIEVELDGVNDITVDNGAGDAVSASITLILLSREEANVVPLPNDNESDSRFHTQFSTGIYINVRRYETQLGEKGRYFE
jgi:hypothetical protein